MISEALLLFSSYPAVGDNELKVLRGCFMSSPHMWSSSAIDLPQRHMGHCF